MTKIFGDVNVTVGRDHNNGLKVLLHRNEVHYATLSMDGFVKWIEMKEANPLVLKEVR